MKPSTRERAAVARHHVFDAVVWTLALMFGVLLFVHEAHAGEHRYANLDPTYQAECGSCHIAYPPALLPAPAWAPILDRLDRHYGVDASLDAAATRRVRDYVQANAGRNRGESVPAGEQLTRISTSRWFLREHRAAGAPSAAAGKRMSDCGACHLQAARGDFSESNLRARR
jgi:hypothetical protein